MVNINENDSDFACINNFNISCNALLHTLLEFCKNRNPEKALQFYDF